MEIVKDLQNNYKLFSSEISSLRSKDETSKSNVKEKVDYCYWSNIPVEVKSFNYKSKKPKKEKEPILIVEDSSHDLNEIETYEGERIVRLILSRLIILAMFMFIRLFVFLGVYVLLYQLSWLL